jgi:hypothetical protein
MVERGAKSSLIWEQEGEEELSAVTNIRFRKKIKTERST